MTINSNYGLKIHFRNFQRSLIFQSNQTDQSEQEGTKTKVRDALLLKGNDTEMIICNKSKQIKPSLNLKRHKTQNEARTHTVLSR